MNLQNVYKGKVSFSAHTQKIVSALQNLDDTQLQNLYRVSPNKLQEIKDYMAMWENDDLYEAISMYKGVAFKALDIASLNQLEKEYLNKNLLILSAFYGVLKPNDLAKPYRLDFNTRLKIAGKSLSVFWRNYYEDLIAENETVFNLASAEFATQFDKSRYNWIDFNFFTIKDGVAKTHATIAKQGRGKLLRAFAVNNIEQVADIKKLAGYKKFFDIK